MNAWLSFVLSLSIFISTQRNEPFHYGTKSPEALAHYQKGWEQILDRGEWTLAEASFRKAVELDSSFLLGWSQVGRISKNPEERAQIFTQLSAQKNEMGGWEKKLLEVYLGSLELIDSKDRGLKITPEQVRNFYQVSERNFSDFLKIFPDEHYVQSEYIEVIHGIYGPEAGLDSLKKQTSSGKKLNPFLISYTAQLQAELKDFEQAFQTGSQLEKILNDSKLPIISFTYAVVQFEKGEFTEAEKLLNQTLRLDENHTLAKRLKKQVEEKLKGF
jgi:tetratricopeptide (TPR) repeat protein